MNEYIDRDALLDDIPAAVKHGGMGEIIGQTLMRYVKRQPASNVAPVVHGRWKEMHYEGGILDGTNFDRCSVCGYEGVFDDPAFKTVFKYCPNCGAKMDGGGSDEDG